MDEDRYELDERPVRLLTWGDQKTLAMLTIVCLAVLAGCWTWRGGWQSRLVDIDQAPPRPVSFQLDMNEAPWPEWTVLPGVGEVLAQRIVASREAEGPFEDAADLQRVAGIGPRTLERIRPYLLPVAQAARQMAEAPGAAEN